MTAELERVLPAGTQRIFAPDAGGRWHEATLLNDVPTAVCGAALAGTWAVGIPEYVDGEDLCGECMPS